MKGNLLLDLALYTNNTISSIQILSALNNFLIFKLIDKSTFIDGESERRIQSAEL